MTKGEFINEITALIEGGEKLLIEFESLRELRNYYGDGAAVMYGSSFSDYDDTERSRLKTKLYVWENDVFVIIQGYFGISHPDWIKEFKISDPDTWLDFKRFGISAINDDLKVMKSYKSRIKFLKDVSDLNSSIIINEDMPFKVFISHSQKDAEFAEALVDLLEVIGIRGDDKIFCSSIAGYWVPGSENIREYLLKQFREHKLIVVFIHSDNYYNSHIGLNEMGGAWVLGTKFYSFLVKGFSFSKMDAIIDGGYISIKVDEEKNAKARLNDFKKELSELFNLEEVDANRWETERDEFLKRVNSFPDFV